MMNNAFVFSSPQLNIENDIIDKAKVNFISFPTPYSNNAYYKTNGAVQTQATGYKISHPFYLLANKTYIICAKGSNDVSILSEVEQVNASQTSSVSFSFVSCLVAGSGIDNTYYEYTPTENKYVRLSWLDSADFTTCIFEKSQFFDKLIENYRERNPIQVQVEENAVLVGKKINVIGDSYVAGGNTGMTTTWHYKMAQKYSMTYRNYGIGGNGLIDPNRNGVPVVSRYTEMDNDADIVIVIGGKNDFNGQYPIDDFKSGLETLCAGLINKYPTKRIMFFTPWRVSMETIAETSPSQASFTISLIDYVNVIVEICTKYMIPVFDTKNSQMFINNSTFRTTYMESSADVSHTNNDGGTRFEPIASRFVAKNI